MIEKMREIGRERKSSIPLDTHQSMEILSNMRRNVYKI